MGWSYSGNPSTSLRDQVRFLIGDTNSASPLLSDEEIDFAVAENGTAAYMAAAVCCEAIVGKLSQSTSKTVGKLSLQNSEKYQNYVDLAARLRKRANNQRMGAPVLMGGGDTYLAPDDSPTSYEDTGEAG